MVHRGASRPILGPRKRGQYAQEPRAPTSGWALGGRNHFPPSPHEKSGSCGRRPQLGLLSRNLRFPHPVAAESGAQGRAQITAPSCSTGTKPGLLGPRSPASTSALGPSMPGAPSLGPNATAAFIISARRDPPRAGETGVRARTGWPPGPGAGVGQWGPKEGSAAGSRRPGEALEPGCRGQEERGGAGPGSKGSSRAPRAAP